VAIERKFMEKSGGDGSPNTDNLHRADDGHRGDSLCVPHATQHKQSTGIGENEGKKRWQSSEISWENNNGDGEFGQLDPEQTSLPPSKMRIILSVTPTGSNASTRLSAGVAIQ